MSKPALVALAIHGGAGALDNVRDDKTAVRYLESIRRTLEHGREILKLGGKATMMILAGSLGIIVGGPFALAISGDCSRMESLSAGISSSGSDSTTRFSMTFCSSRTLPGHG